MDDEQYELESIDEERLGEESGPSVSESDGVEVIDDAESMNDAGFNFPVQGPSDGVRSPQLLVDIGLTNLLLPVSGLAYSH